MDETFDFKPVVDIRLIANFTYSDFRNQLIYHYLRLYTQTILVQRR